MSCAIIDFSEPSGYRHMRSAIWVVALILATTNSQADEVPLWEAGLGPAVVTLPAYRGSAQSDVYVLPMPYFVYRGKFLKADRDGLSGSLFESDNTRLIASLSVSPPVSNRGVEARRGMSDLAPTIEVGPQLSIDLFESPGPLRRFKLEIPLRAAFSVESSPQLVGFVLHPKLGLDFADLPKMKGWKLGVSAGPVFSDSRQNAYFYTVAPIEALPGRPAYVPGSGYGGLQASATLSRRFPKYWVGAFARYDNLSGSAFESSPLVQRTSTAAIGIAITRILKTSKRMVTESEE